MASSAGSWFIKIFTFVVVLIGLISGIIQIAEYLNKQNNPPAAPTAIVLVITATAGSPPDNPTAPPAPASTSTVAPQKVASPVAPTIGPTQAPTLPPTLVPTQAPTAPPNTPPACTAIGQSWTSPVDGMTLVCVPANKFMMGSAASDTNAQDDERPQHEVTLSAYWIDKTEVTNRQFELFVKTTNYQTDAERLGSGVIFNGSTWKDTKGAFWKQPKGPGSDLNGKSEHPVVLVSWNDAAAYCRWAGRGLPTDAQWEMAARGTDGRIYPWGNAVPDANRANFNYNVKDTTPVGKYSSGASPYGALDMAGNAWEWVNDGYDGNYYHVSPGSNPPGPGSGTNKVLRGGGWHGSDGNLRMAYRYDNLPTHRSYNLGFRCAAPP